MQALQLARQALILAAQAHQNGRLPEARALYDRSIGLHAGQTEAWQLSGLARLAGRFRA